MSGFDENKKYDSFKIPVQQQRRESEPPKQSQLSFTDAPYYEIEYDACPIPGVGKFVQKPKPQAIKQPEKDGIRELFIQMRNIARAHPSIYDFSRFFDRRIQNDNAAIFYKQGMFMKDFTDDYNESVPFTQYFPAYQMMGYQQLRTYFTWRTQVRNGNISATSLSYVFLYIYELLNNIGVDDPQEGLNKLNILWQEYRMVDHTLDKYILRWMKDYRIYYGLVPPLRDGLGGFDQYCAISKYNIKKSKFFSDGNEKLIRDCFDAVLNDLKQTFTENGLSLEAILFQPGKKMPTWLPFRDALFYQKPKQTDRQVVLSPNEIYALSQGKWGIGNLTATEDGRQLMGYVMKQMEAVLRRVTKYKFKLSADINSVRLKTIGSLSLEALVTASVLRFYRELTKTVVKVDKDALSLIRKEALSTQQKLIVPEEEAPAPIVLTSAPVTVASNNVWQNLKNALDDTELEALTVVLEGNNVKKFADECGIMVEVLVDGINEKAMDHVGDNLMDEEFIVYDDYIEHVKGLIG